MSQSTQNLSASCLVPSSFDEDLTRQAAKACLQQLNADPDLVIALVTSDYRPHLPTLIETLQIDGHATRIAGGSACGLVGVGREQELISGISLLFLRLPATTITTSTSLQTTIGPDATIVFTHPLHTSFEDQLGTWQDCSNEPPLLGGSITGGPDEEDLFLFSENGPETQDLLAVHLTGGVKVRPLVAPGCRPIGDPLIVTAANGKEILQLGNQEPYDVLEKVFQGLGNDLQIEADGNLFAGLAINEEMEEFGSGDFHVRQIVGATLEDGRLRLTSSVRTGQTLQFQLRDPIAAEMTLRSECERIKEAHGSPFASLLFLGKGRGKRLFGVEDRNVQAFEEAFGKLPLAGLYSFGEIGPAHSTTIRHDHSVCGALFYSDSTP